jgi:hypothetical protein
MMESLKMTAFRDVVLCSLVEVDQCFKGAYWLYRQGNEPGCTKYL